MQATDFLSIEELVPWLRLATLTTLPRHVPARLVREHGTPLAAFHAARHGKVRDLDPADLAALRAPFPAALHVLAQATLAWAGQPGNHLLTLNDAAYPALLREIPDPPVLLHVQGQVALLGRDAVGVVGSRNATVQGMTHAEQFARALSEAGIAIVSGLALGIDRAAHTGGLAARGGTIAVIGTGIDVTYPRANAALHARIREHGCIVSEFTLGTPARPGHFPVRNRIISGLARGVLVVEAAQRSGSLITARLAAQQGRDVFAIPGSIHATLAKGCHDLIREGAKLVDTAAHILEALGYDDTPGMPARACNEDVMLAELTRAAKVLLDALTYDPTWPDDLAARLHLDPADTQASLLALELAGVVERLPGGAFCRLKQ